MLVQPCIGRACDAHCNGVVDGDFFALTEYHVPAIDKILPMPAGSMVRRHLLGCHAVSALAKTPGERNPYDFGAAYAADTPDRRRAMACMADRFIAAPHRSHDAFVLAGATALLMVHFATLVDALATGMVMRCRDGLCVQRAARSVNAWHMHVFSDTQE